MKKLFLNEDGYVAVLTLIFMPIVIGLALLVIDIGRGNNAHTDLQAATDALALAGARELDGRSNSIDRAKSAMTNINNSVSFLGTSGASVAISLTSNEFIVVFLEDIPDSDDELIDQAFLNANATVDGTAAKYVYVAVPQPPQSQTLIPYFPIPTGLFPGGVPIRTEAVATYISAACDVTPIFICNPFEENGGADVRQSFAQGDFYGRQLRMRISSAGSPGPGNFGYLRTDGSGGSVLRDALATGKPGVCYTEEGLDTEPGGTIGPVRQGLNTRFGIYGGSMNSKSSNYDFRPAINARRGASNPNSCTAYSEEPDVYNAMAMPLGDGVEIILPTGGGISEDSNWNIDLYWDVTQSGQNPHPSEANPAYIPPAAPTAEIKSNFSSYPGGPTPLTTTPSRYDTYRYAIANGLTGTPSPNGDKGDSMCYSGYSLPGYTSDGDRRKIFAAIVNCIQYEDEIQGAVKDLPAEAFASLFVTKPFIFDNPDSYIALELIDIAGASGNGTLSNFLREEATLVR